MELFIQRFPKFRPYLWYPDSFVLSIFNLSGGTAQSGRSHCSIWAESLLNFAGRGDFAQRRTHFGVFSNENGITESVLRPERSLCRRLRIISLTTTTAGCSVTWAFWHRWRNTTAIRWQHKKTSGNPKPGHRKQKYFIFSLSTWRGAVQNAVGFAM